MKANQLATLVLRLMGIYCLIVFFPIVPVFSNAVIYAGSIHDYSGIAAIITMILSLAVQLGVGILLIAFSVPWGKRLTTDFADSNVTALPFEQIQVLAFAVAGVLIFAESLPQLFNSFLSFLNSLHQMNAENRIPGEAADNWRILLTSLGTILKAALGLWMFFGARGFANLWRSLKNFGTPKPPEN